MTPTPKELEEFLDAYITAAFWSSTDNAEDCDVCAGDGVHATRTAVGSFDSTTCETCHGTGRVPAMDSDGGEPFDSHFGREHLAPESLERMRQDCLRFLEQHGVPDYSLSHGGPTEWSDLARAGHDFWLTRNGHGVGFWDRGFPDAIGDAFTAAAKAFGGQDLVLGDDGLVYAEGGA